MKPNHDSPAQPTLIVALLRARHQSWPLQDGPGAMRAHLADTVRSAVSSGLPTVCVLPFGFAEFAGELPAECRVMEPSHHPSQSEGGSYALARAIQATAHSPGWLILPASSHRTSTAAILAVARAVREHPLAMPISTGLPTPPFGFGAEFYSELIRVNTDQDLLRLLSRYPAINVGVDGESDHRPRQAGRP